MAAQLMLPYLGWSTFAMVSTGAKASLPAAALSPAPAAAPRLRQLLRGVHCSWHAAGHRTRRLPARCALLLPQL